MKIVEKSIVTVEDKTLIFQQEGGSYHQADFDVLSIKQWVKIWGPARTSLPMQITAKQIVITE